MRCQQCGNLLKGYFEFYTCGTCYTKNVNSTQKKLLEQEKSK